MLASKVMHQPTAVHNLSKRSVLRSSSLIMKGDEYLNWIPRFTLTPHMYINLLLHHICTSIYSYTTYVHQYTLNHICTSKYSYINKSVYNCTLTPHMYINVLLHHICTSIYSYTNMYINVLLHHICTSVYSYTTYVHQFTLTPHQHSFTPHMYINVQL